MCAGRTWSTELRKVEAELFGNKRIAEVLCVEKYVEFLQNNGLYQKKEEAEALATLQLELDRASVEVRVTDPVDNSSTKKLLLHKKRGFQTWDEELKDFSFFDDIQKLSLLRIVLG